MNKRSNIDKAIEKIDTKIAQAEITGKESYMYNDDIILMLNDFKSILTEEDSGVEVKKPSTLKDFGYADGDYWGCCNTCAGKFTGDKRASTCSKCATYKLSLI